MPASLTIVPANQTLTVNVYLANGSTAATCYTTADLTSSVTFPAAVSTTTTYWVRTDGYYVVSATQSDGSEVANGNEGRATAYLAAGAPTRLEPGPTYAQMAADDAALSGTYAPINETFYGSGYADRLSAQAYPAPTTDVPTLAVSGPGGPNPISGGTPFDYAYNTANVTKLGCYPVLVTQFSSNYFQNQVSGETGGR